MAVDLTVAAVPAFFGTMAAEHRYLKRIHADDYGVEPSDYTPEDTKASLAMGVGSLVAPFVVPRLLRPLTPGRGRHGRKLLTVVAGAAVVTTVADGVVRKLDERDASPSTERASRVADRIRRVAGPVAVGGVVIAAATTVSSRMAPEAQWRAGGERRDRGSGPWAHVAAVVGWDFIYYWNHRFMHEVRGLWAIHVVHHSSERYNLSTALRQPVADAFGVFVPYGLMARAGLRPAVIAQARGINLLYQYWIHTETIRSLGPAEEVLNTASHHRVHHGSQSQYIDRNHGSILIIWDRLFGTFERERDRVIYGLTTNIETYDPIRIATHEYRDMVGDVSRSTNWRDRLSFVLRGPGWAYDRRRAAVAPD